MAEETSSSVSGGAALPLAGGLLTIDLGALAANYRVLAKLSAPAEAAASVKADAYGLGVDHVVPALLRAGCRRFFVALAEEGIAVRKAAPEAQIFVLNGVFSPQTAAACVASRLIPVLNSQHDIAVWESYGWQANTAQPCAIHVDTGMNRLGLGIEQAKAFAAENALTGALKPVLLMSHLACGDEPVSEMNRRQVELFQQLRTVFPGIESSLANSAGIFHGKDYVFDVTRPGIALYGGAAVNGVDNPMLPVVRAEARIVQVREVQAGRTVSYGATATLSRDSIIAVAAAGYADGYPRAGSGAGVPLRRAEQQGASGFIHGREVPLVGRVTMDLSSFDVTDLGAGTVNAGEFIELFGPDMPIDRVARAAGTIAYELLTSLGHRYHRTYLGTAG